MLPLLVGGPELLLKRLVGPLSRELPHDQLFRWSEVLPLEKGGVAGREPSVRPWDDAVVSEYELKLSRMCCSSDSCVGPLFGDDGH